MNLFQRLFGDSTRTDQPEVRLFVESMLIMIAADGVVDEAELDQFVRQVHIRTEFKGVKQKVIDKHVQAAFADIRRDGLDSRIHEIAAGLTTREQRLAALGMAMTIASGDGALVPTESSVLERMRIAFQLPSDIYDKAKAAVALGNSPDAAFLGEEDARTYTSPEALYVETLLLMAAADGVLEPRELDRFGQQLAEHEEFFALNPDRAATYLDLALKRLEKEGVEVRVDAIADGLPEPRQRKIAFKLALEMCVADGEASSHERTLLKLFQSRFELADSTVKELLGAVLGEDP